MKLIDPRPSFALRRNCYRAVTSLTFWLLLQHTLGAETLVLKNGMNLTGSVVKVGSLGDDILTATTGGGKEPRMIIMVDNGLARTFVSTYQKMDFMEGPTAGNRIKIPQPTADRGSTIGTVGTAVSVTPFDDYGRRIFTMLTAKGKVSVVQGITEISPLWTRVEGLSVFPAYLWDMRIATSSIPRETLSKILLNRTDRTDSTTRLNVVRLFIQSERYDDALQELKGVIDEFPELEDLKAQVVELHQMKARKYLAEIKLRRDAGQYDLARAMISQFPREDVAGELLVQVAEMVEEFKEIETKAADVLRALESDLAELDDGNAKKQMEAVFTEIKSHLSFHTYLRLGAYQRLADDKTFGPEERLALAASGWLLGSGQSTQNIATALSLVHARRLIREYLNCDVLQRQQEILEELASLEGGAPNYLVPLLATMTPPLATPEGTRFVAKKAESTAAAREEDKDLVPAAEAPLAGQNAVGIPGLLQIETAGLPDSAPIRYHIQLPPEYDPHRLYPAVLSLHGAHTNPELQIDWWAGSYDAQRKMRMGQAGRHGYIVIAPEWTTARQMSYRYSAAEHATVLFTLRDAIRRFSIDTDRVFLSGHSMGGDAAWDIGLAHPDLWAGMLLIGAVADYGKPDSPLYVARAWENGRHIPMYFVRGDKDAERIRLSGRDLDRYLTKPGFDAMVVEYRGRGHEHFQEDILQMFSWMALHQRDFYPRQWQVVAQRPWDNFFWWAEFSDFPESTIVLPGQLTSAGQPSTIKGLIRENNSIGIKTSAKKVTLWLTPRMVDFEQRFYWQVNNRKMVESIEADPAVILEDARTRGDRLHPFWAKFEVK